jgi:ABC-type nitrate/sulfonate/bicarbonate transport system substrate-binding protein
MMGLIRGEFDMATAPLDSVIAYSEGEGAPQAPKDADLVAVFGVNNGALSLVSEPEILGGIQLHYKTIAVDANGSAISFVVRELLARWQYPPNGYKTIAVGDAPARWGALREKRAAATLLTPPFTQLALAQGYTPLLNVADTLRGYQGTVAATRRDWATTNADAVTGFVRGYRSGLDWLKAPANRSAALDILRREMPEMTVASAVESYGLLVADAKGFDPGGKIDPVGARRVFELRRLYGPQGKGISQAGYFIDESYFQRAIRP